MAEEIVRHMVDHGRGDDVTNIVYPGAGHAFLVQDFMPPPGSGIGQQFDFGGRSLLDDLVFCCSAGNCDPAVFSGRQTSEIADFEYELGSGAGFDPLCHTAGLLDTLEPFDL